MNAQPGSTQEGVPGANLPEPANGPQMGKMMRKRQIWRRLIIVTVLWLNFAGAIVYVQLGFGYPLWVPLPIIAILACVLILAAIRADKSFRDILITVAASVIVFVVCLFSNMLFILLYSLGFFDFNFSRFDPITDYVPIIAGILAAAIAAVFAALRLRSQSRHEG